MAFSLCFEVRVSSQILEQVEGGDLIVNKGTESRPKDDNGSERELGGVEGYDAALKLAQVLCAT